MKSLAAMCVITVTGSACKAAVSSHGAVVRDSAGVRIVEYTNAVPSVGRLAFSEDPIYRYGETSGQYEFQVIAFGALQSDGSAIVNDAGAQEVLRIAPDGTSHAVLASRGRGPREVRRVSGLELLGQDTVLIEDDGNARISVFTADGGFRSTNLGADRSITLALRVIGVAHTGHLLMTTSSFNSRFSQPWLLGHLVRFDLETLAADTVATFDFAPFAGDESRNPFSPMGRATATQGQFIITRSDRPEVKWLSPDGAIVQILRWNPERAYPGNAEWEAFVHQLDVDFRRYNPNLAQQELERAIHDDIARYELDSAEPLPLFGLTHGDAEGRVWLGGYDPFPLTHVPGYTVIDRNGTWLGPVEIPDSFRLLDAGYGRVLGVMQDHNDIQSVVMYALASVEY